MKRFILIILFISSTILVTGKTTQTRITWGNFIQSDVDSVIIRPPTKLNTTTETLVDLLDTVSGIEEYVKPKVDRTIIKTINIIGQEVTEEYKGIIINIYDDGSFLKLFRE